MFWVTEVDVSVVGFGVSIGARSGGMRHCLDVMDIVGETFLFACDKLRPYISGQSTKMRQPIDVETRVAITI